MTPAQIAENPVQGEFFTAAADMPERLVREALQNSLGAALDDEVVRVRFTFRGKAHALNPQRAGQYLDGLRPHLAAVATAQTTTASGPAANDEARAVCQAHERLKQPLEYLVVEDFGTHGLTGDVQANGANEPGNNFWGFFRQIGISTKSNDAAGSWGLGKWVFPDASGINALLAVSRRAGEEDVLLMGLSILKTHTLNGQRFPAYGHFAAADEAPDTNWFPMPVSGQRAPQFLLDTANDFQLRRTVHAGTSVIIPWPKDELTPSAIARAVIVQYFLPILRRRLAVVIQHPEEDDRIIDADHIIEDLEWIGESDRDEESEQSLRGLLELAAWAEAQDRAHIHLRLPSARSNPLRDEHAELNLPALQEQYQRGDKLAFELHTEIQQTNAYAPTETSCRVYLQRDDDLKQGHDYFVRGNLHIPKIDHLRSQRARSLLLVDGHAALGHLLRDSEGPAHAEWDRNAARVKEKWARGAGARVDDVRRAPLRIIQALVERPKERQMDALTDLFPADLALPRAPCKPTPPVNGNGGRITEPTPPTARTGMMQVSEVSGGFRVRANPERIEVGSRWSLQMAYALERGGKNKAFTQFESGAREGQPDFSLHRGLFYEAKGCVIRLENDKHNQLTLTVHQPDCALTVQGFDDRDLVVELEQAAPHS